MAEQDLPALPEPQIDPGAFHKSVEASREEDATRITETRGRE